MRRMFKPLVALTAGLALLAITAAPSAASTGTISAGTVTVNLTPTLTAPLAGTGTGCSSLSATMDTPTTGTATVNLDAGFQYNSAFGNDWLLRGSGTGVLTIGTGMSVTGITLTGVNIYPRTAACTAGTPAKCGTISVSFGATGLTGTWSGTVSVPNLTGTAVLAGTGTIAAAGCTPPFSALNGKTATISNMTVTF